MINENKKYTIGISMLEIMRRTYFPHNGNAKIYDYDSTLLGEPNKFGRQLMGKISFRNEKKVKKFYESSLSLH